jgi:hypothetical protein
MPRLSDSLQRPTTLLTLKKSKESLISYTGASRGQIILMTDDSGTLNGEIRIANGSFSTNDPSGKPLLDGQGNPVLISKTAPTYPVGSIIYFAGPTPPAGWLFCNGSVHRKELYHELCLFLDAYDGNSKYYANTTHFKIPDYTNSKNFNQGGVFIRNLNEFGPYGNSAAPDWNETDELDYYQKGEYKITPKFVNRQFGTIQLEKFPKHNHDYITANTANVNAILTGETGEVHSHRYFGTEGATNGIQIGNLNSKGANNTAIIARSAIGFSDNMADTPVRALPPTSIPGVDFDAAANPPLPTGQEFAIGNHIHVGWIGYGKNPYSANTIHFTYHHTANNVNNSQYVTTSSGQYFDPSANNFNNARETQPKNYSVLFCIKY